MPHCGVAKISAKAQQISDLAALVSSLQQQINDLKGYLTDVLEDKIEFIATKVIEREVRCELSTTNCSPQAVTESRQLYQCQGSS